MATPLELDVLFSRYVLFLTYLLMAVTGSGYLALMWSTVVLLGGFVTALGKKDYWCLTIISMMQAARIFNELAENLLPNFFELVTRLISDYLLWIRSDVWHVSEAFHGRPWLVAATARSTWWRFLTLFFCGCMVLPFLVMGYVPALVYMYCGPVACIALAFWRVAQRDYGDGDGDDKLLVPALDLFYSLVLVQGGLYLVWLFVDSWWAGHLFELRRRCGLPVTCWCRLVLVDYLLDTRAKCWRDLSYIHGSKVADYAVHLLGTESLDDNLAGARLLDAFVGQGLEVRSLLIPSRPRIQKLIDALGWRQQAGPREMAMRKVAARIVAHLAGDIHLAQFPGAIRCISSLLLQDEATIQANSRREENSYPDHGKLPPEKKTMLRQLENYEKKRGITSRNDDACNCNCNELILQGRAILWGLASDHHNCRDICGTAGLLAKITAPLYSTTLINDIMIDDWADVVNKSLQVLHRLIRADGRTGRRLRREISVSGQAMRNLDTMLHNQQQNPPVEQLRLRAIEIMTELALDLSINLSSETKQKFFKKLLQIFLQEQWIAAMTGKTLALLSTNSDGNVALMMTTHCDIVGPLTEMLNVSRNTTYRIIMAANILRNICAHGSLDKMYAMETLLPKVLKLNHNISSRRDNTSSDQGNEEQTGTKALQEAFLSLTLVIYDKLINTDAFDNVAQKVAMGHAAFVANLKTILKENCQATTESLRIVKLCGQIAVSMMQHNHYIEHFKDQEFVKSLSTCSAKMSNLESCMLFTGTNFGQKNTLRPLLYDIEKEAQRLVHRHRNPNPSRPSIFAQRTQCSSYQDSEI